MTALLMLASGSVGMNIMSAIRSRPAEWAQLLAMGFMAAVVFVGLKYEKPRA